LKKKPKINEEIDRLRLAATTALMSRRDVIIVASVFLYLRFRQPRGYGKVAIHLEVGNIFPSQRTIKAIGRRSVT
jgi:excinuclease ABC subunit B